jgi:hypothetical protein
MEPSVLFKIANSMALIGWITIAVLHHRALTYKIVFNGIVLLLCLFYASAIAWALSSNGGSADFGSLQGVMHLFTDPKAVLAGWVHYLAFDMVVGLTIVRSSAQHNINRFLVAPCLFFTFMFGPVGLLLYYILLMIKQKRMLVSVFNE